MIGKQYLMIEIYCFPKQNLDPEQDGLQGEAVCEMNIANFGHSWLLISFPDP